MLGTQDPTETHEPVQGLRAPDRLFIGGEWVEPISGEHFEVINPSTEEPLVRVALANEGDISRADEQHAVELANDTPYGLNNSVFTHDVTRAYELARQLRSGTVGHNMFRSDFGISFGGFKQSGIGREGLVEGLYAYVESKTIVLDAEPELT